jgi:hypothetical protein
MGGPPSEKNHAYDYSAVLGHDKDFRSQIRE